ncbi:hypothetical protein B0H13DRAFT_1930028 [Mycena leptocephala]|nr:hypothetical protein B0H13DRAFT_1930028 [Mycena leptocephala]
MTKQCARKVERLRHIHVGPSYTQTNVSRHSLSCLASPNLNYGVLGRKGGTKSYQEGGGSSLQTRTGETTQGASEPAMRPSAAELLNHERVRFTSKAQNLLIREFELKERESAINDALQNKNAEIQSFQPKSVNIRRSFR